ncbi:unnamed protein product [Closterium sp. NIES-53]
MGPPSASLPTQPFRRRRPPPPFPISALSRRGLLATARALPPHPADFAARAFLPADFTAATATPSQPPRPFSSPPALPAAATTPSPPGPSAAATFSSPAARPAAATYRRRLHIPPPQLRPRHQWYPPPRLHVAACTSTRRDCPVVTYTSRRRDCTAVARNFRRRDCTPVACDFRGRDCTDAASKFPPPRLRFAACASRHRDSLLPPCRDPPSPPVASASRGFRRRDRIVTACSSRHRDPVAPCAFRRHYTLPHSFTLTVGVSSSTTPSPPSAKLMAFSKPPPSPTPLSKMTLLRVASAKSPKLRVASLGLSATLPHSLPGEAEAAACSTA